MSWDILPKGNLQYFLQKLKGKLDLKVDAVSGKGLSTNDFTTTEKNKLAGIEAGAQVNPTIDSALSDSSVNAVQNKIIKGALDSKAGREEIPTVNDNTITIQLNGTTIESFTLNQTTNETINIQVTKSSVGLDNVPNVSTNDQTPTFTQASTRTNIASGEKLSVIFGKIMKWFADLKTVAFSGSYSDLSDTPSTDSLLTALPTWTATPTDDTYLLRRDTGGAANYGQVKFSSIWSYINSKVSAAGYTKNAGTVTQVKVGSAAYNPSSGVVSLPSYPTSVNYATSAGSAGTATSAGSAAKGTNNKFETTFLTLGSNGNEPSVTMYNSVSGDGTLKVGMNPNDTAMGSSGRNLYLPIGSMYSSNQATLATVEYLNSNFATKKVYADYISDGTYNANTNIAIPTNSAVTADTSNNTFRFKESGVYILIFHIAVKVNGTTGRSWLKFINDTNSNTVISSIHYGEYATHDFMFVGRIASNNIFCLVTVEGIVINGGGIGPSYMETIQISS